MNQHSAIFISLVTLTASAMLACGNDSNNTPSPVADAGADGSADSGTVDGGGTDGSATNPPMPALGTTEVDRAGRPAINVLLNHVFDATAAAGVAKDQYNADSDPTKWGSDFEAELAKNQAIFDGLDTVCGNQLGYGAPASATSYSLLANLLVDDRLYLDTSRATCSKYLAVELAALGTPPTAPTDCGGRALSYDVMDTSYSLFITNITIPVTDGVNANDVALNTSFPFLAAPH